MNGLYLTGFEIYVCKGVQFRHHNIDIVRADAVGDGGDALAVALTCNGHEFTGLMTEFNVCEIFTNHVYAGRVSHHDHIVCQFFRLQVNMKYGTVSVDDEF